MSDHKHTPDFVDIVFDGPPGPAGPGFVEVEDSDGRSIRWGEWLQRNDGCWALRTPAHTTITTREDCAKTVLASLVAADAASTPGEGRPAHVLAQCAVEYADALVVALGGGATP